MAGRTTGRMLSRRSLRSAWNWNRRPEADTGVLHCILRRLRRGVRICAVCGASAGLIHDSRFRIHCANHHQCLVFHLLDAADEQRAAPFQRSFRNIPRVDRLLSRIHGRQGAIAATEDNCVLIQAAAF
jgi:hypothetical protein